MALDPRRIQELIVKELGQTWNPDFDELVTMWWELHADKAYAGGGVQLQRLYARLEGIQYLQGLNWVRFDWEEGSVRQEDSQKFDHLATLFAQTTQQIATLEERTRGRQSPDCQQITTQTPLPEYEGPFDPNDRVYRGDPTRRRLPITRG